MAGRGVYPVGLLAHGIADQPGAHGGLPAGHAVPGALWSLFVFGGPALYFFWTGTDKLVFYDNIIFIKSPGGGRNHGPTERAVGAGRPLCQVDRRTGGNFFRSRPDPAPGVRGTAMAEVSWSGVAAV